MSKKALLSGLVFGTYQYVLAHGQCQLKNGKGLSATLLGPYQIRNPRRAFKVAQELSTPHVRTRHRFNARGQTPFEEMFNIPPPWEPPWPGAQKVPHTCYVWY